MSIDLYAIQTLTKPLYYSSRLRNKYCFYCRMLLLALRIALICSTTLL